MAAMTHRSPPSTQPAQAAPSHRHYRINALPSTASLRICLRK